MAKYRQSLPDRYLVAVDESGVYLRETLLVNHVDASVAVLKAPEAHYHAKPIKWTAKRLQELKTALAVLEYRLVEYKLIPGHDEAQV